MPEMVKKRETAKQEDDEEKSIGRNEKNSKLEQDMRRKENTASHHQTDATIAKKGRSRRHRTNYCLDSRMKLDLCSLDPA